MGPAGCSDAIWHASRSVEEHAARRSLTIRIAPDRESWSVFADRDMLHDCLAESMRHAIEALPPGASLTVGCELRDHAVAFVMEGDFSTRTPPPAAVVEEVARMGGRLVLSSPDDGSSQTSCSSRPPSLSLELALSSGCGFRHMAALMSGSFPGSDVPRDQRLCLLDHAPGRPCWTLPRTSGEPRRCSDCMAFRMDKASLSPLTSVLLLASSDESILYLFPRCLVARAGHAVIPVPSPQDLAVLAAELSPDAIVIDNQIRDADPEILRSDLRDSPSTSAIPVILLDEGEHGGGEFLSRHADDASLVSAVNTALLSNPSWRRRNGVKRPAVLFWASRPGVGRMLGEMLLDMGLMPVSSVGPFDFASRVQSLEPQMAIIQSEYSSPDTECVTSLLSASPGTQALPLLLIGGNPGWLHNRLSLHIPADAPARLIEIGATRLLRASGVRMPPLLVIEDAELGDLLLKAFEDRYGYVCRTAGPGEPAELGCADTVVFQSATPPGPGFRVACNQARLLMILPRTSMQGDACRENETLIDRESFTLPALWRILEEFD
jgi:hypothetical protein